MGPLVEGDRGGGAPLSPADRQVASDPSHPLLGAVHLHTDSRAAAAARTLNARAFTSGTNIFFSAGRYAPGTGQGQSLLAHELAHVLGPPTNAAGGTIGSSAIQLAPEVPEQVTHESARAEFSGKGFFYLIQHQIQWHYVTLLSGFGDFDLVVMPPPALRSTLTAQEIAAASVDVLLSAMGVPVKAGGREALTAKVAEDIEAYGLTGARGFRLSVDGDLVRGQIEPAAFQVYLESLGKGFAGRLLVSPLIAAGSFGARQGPSQPATPGPATGPATSWAFEKVGQLKALIAEARSKRAAPKDLPDDVAAEHDSRTGDWYLRVWAQFGTDRKHRVSHAIRLEPDEIPEQLLERARGAVSTALLQAADAEARAHQGAAPAWARTLLRELEQRVTEVRRNSPAATDVPDGMTLDVAPDLRLRIWVQRQGLSTVERNAGSVPLTEQATTDRLMPYVRRLAAVLRQHENAPGAVPEDVEVSFDPSEAALAAFPAHLEPEDLRGDKITVTGAQNKFHLVLDFEAVYGGGPIADLYIASKLHSQYIHVFWEVHRVPAGLPPPQGMTEAPADWARRWLWLYNTFNPPGPRRPGTAAQIRSQLGTPVSGTSGSDLATRVGFPQEPGEYVIRCYTGHAPVGQDKVRRLSSEAYYPVRVEPIKEVVSAAAGARAEAMTLTAAELKAIDAELATSETPAERRPLLLALRGYRSGYLERLRRRETLTLGEGTAEELQFARRTLGMVQQLAAMQPALIKAARAQEVTPSSLIADPDLLTLYWFIIAEHKTIEGYQQELAAQINYLTGLQGRAKEFGKNIKASSPYQYSVNAAFVSEVTGHVYPLVFMLGEAPDAYRTAPSRAGAATVPAVAYTLADITDRKTQKEYHGASYTSGSAGHREAIDNAFESFGDDATYGEGLVAVTIPPGRAGTADPNHPGTGVKYYRSEEGPLQKVLWALGIIAAVAGLAALAATGVGAPAAAAVLGLIAGTAGAITSLHNISERSRRHTLEWDAEMALDIIGIVGVIPAAGGARMALAARAAGFSNVSRAGRFLQFYGWAETGATVVLVPVQMADDIHRIETDTSLAAEQKKKLIADVKLRGLQTGLMMVGSAAAARMGGHAPGRSGDFDDTAPGLQRQIELLELEGFGQYKSLQDRGLLDANGSWTPASRMLGPAPQEIEAPRAAVMPSPTVEKPPVAAETPAPGAKKPAPAVDKPQAAVEKPPSAVEEPTPKTEKPSAAAEPDAPGTAAKPTSVIGAVEQRQAELDAINVKLSEIKEKRDAAEKHRLTEKDALARTAIAKDAEATQLERRARATQDPELRAVREEEAARVRAEHEAAKQQQIDNQEEVNALERDRADAEKELATAKENLVLAQAGRRLSDTKAVTSRLQAHVDAAVAKYATGELVLSDRQAAAVAGGVNVEMYRGDVIDAAVKLAILTDPDLAGLKVTPKGVYGPDIYDPLTKRWWDITTPGAWLDHVKLYTDEFGTGMFLSTHAAIPK